MWKLSTAGHLTYICACITRVCLYWLVLLVFFELDGDGDEPEVGEEGPVDPVVAGGGPAAALHAVEDAFGHVPPPLHTSLPPMRR